jgi:hypothetical protein
VIALILGGAPSVWTEASEAGALVWPARCLIVAANLAGIAWGDHLDGWASLHTDLLPGWAAERKGNGDFQPFTPDVVAERWPGSSGLYAAQVALFEMGASGVILCGVPMDSQAGHFTGRTPWESTTSYREAFKAALPDIGGRVRSMGGWTAEVFGQPSAAWIDAIDKLRPLGATRPQHLRTTMHKVTNVSDTTQRFNARRPSGELYIARLAPGASDEFDADVNQAVFSRGLLKATNLEKPAKSASKAAAKKAPAKKAAPAGHKPLSAPPAEEPKA